MAQTILLIGLVCIAIALVALVLIQQGKGADAGASFGGGASQTVFGSAGSGNFLTKSTWTLGLLFFALCLALGYLARQQAENTGRIDFSAPAAQTQPKQAPASNTGSGGGDVPAMPASGDKSTTAPAKSSGSAADVPSAPAAPAQSQTGEKPASTSTATDAKSGTAPKS